MNILHKFKKISWWIKLPAFFIMFLISLFNFPKLQYILYPLPEEDGFSLVGHEAIIKIGRSSDLSDGQLYKYTYCDPKECASKPGVEKISDTNYAYVEKLNLTKMEIQNYPKMQSENFASEVHSDIYSSWDKCLERRGNSSFLFADTGCVVWYKKTFFNKNKNKIFKFGEIKLYEEYHYGNKAYLTNLNSEKFVGIVLSANYKERKRSFKSIYIFSPIENNFSLGVKKKDDYIELISFK